MIKLIEKIESIPKSYFYLTDIRKISELNNQSLKVALSRLVKAGRLNRIIKGVYTIDVNQINWKELAIEIYYPSYISFETALAYYNILSQKPIHLTMATTKRSKIIKTKQKNLIYRHLQEKMFWGYIKKDGYFIAKPEKAFLDLAYLSLNGYAKFDIEEMNTDFLNKKRVKEYLKKANYPRLDKFLCLKYKI